MSVVSLHMGQAGVQLGDVCWLQYAVEHGLDEEGQLESPDNARLHKSHSTLTLRSERSLGSLSYSESDNLRPGDGFHNFFQELGNGKYSPMALFVDMEPSVIDGVRTGPLRGLYRPRLMLSDKEDAANNYARGRYAYRRSFHEVVGSGLRQLTEACDRLQGFIVYHSIGGGTGSGYYARLLTQIKEENPKVSVLTSSVHPSPRLSTAVVEPYNAILHVNATLDQTDCVFFSDNEAMYNICMNSLGTDNPNYKNLNRLLATAVSSITASLRFKGSLNADFTDFQTNLVPYPRIHFATMSYAPIVSGKKMVHESLSASDLSLKVFDGQNCLSTCEREPGRYMACCLLYRGDITPKDVNYAIAQIKAKGAVQFVPWCPTGVKVGLNTKPPSTIPGSELESCGKSVCMVANNTSVQRSFENLNQKYAAMLKKRAFVHWYTGEGMAEEEFREAQENLLALENDYDELER